jgi:hypothetical protein
MVNKSKKFIQKAIKHPDALHKALKVSKGEKIPEAKIEKATHSDNPRLRKQANFSRTLHGLRK